MNKYRVTYTIPDSEGKPSMVLRETFASKDEAENFMANLRTVGVRIRSVGGAMASGIVSDAVVETVQ